MKLGELKALFARIKDDEHDVDDLDVILEVYVEETGNLEAAHLRSIEIEHRCADTPTIFLYGDQNQDLDEEEARESEGGTS
ncbi:MAG: hypothetical protein HOW73_17160 [Polyangiaceae bacterium]|nr:hypothetical protein [Polyangiaceae bacterium]